MKTCFKCGVEKPLSEFYKHPMMADGHLNKCKECTKQDVKQNRDDKREYYILYDRNRLDTPARQIHLGRQYQSRKVCAEYQNQKRETTKRYRAHNPEKHRAHTIVNNAIRNGRLYKQPCEVCGSEDGLEAHHEDYSKPLDVRWLCRKHHGNQHRKSRIAA